MLHLPQLGITRLDGFGFWYDWGMGNIKKQADAQVRIYKSTRKRLKLRAIQLGISVAELVDKLSKKI
jgi:hypothetical protein